MNRFVDQPFPDKDILDDLNEDRFGEQVRGVCAQSERADNRIHRGCDLKPYTANRLTELSGRGGGASLTLAFSLLSEAQSRNESVLWLSSRLKPFYPPDAAVNGVDLEALPIVFLPSWEEAYLAATRLLSSGGFGLAVWDLVSWKRPPKQLPVAYVGRLNAIARRHHLSILVLTDKTVQEPSLACLVSLRLQIEAQFHHPELLEVKLVRDKCGITKGRSLWEWRCQLPDGLPSSTSVSPPGFASKEKSMAG